MGKNTEKVASDTPMQQTSERPTLESPLSVVVPSASSAKDRFSPQSRHRLDHSHHRRASIKQPWTPEQDSQLRDLVMEHGRGRWSAVASTFAGRSPKQCRERWLNHLDPSISRHVWTREEDLRLVELHEQFGNAWARIAEQIPGRTDNSVKNHWHSSSIRKLLRERSGDSKSGSDSDYESHSSSPRLSKSGSIDESGSPRSLSNLSASGSPRGSCSSPFSVEEDDYTLKKGDLDAFLDGIDFDELLGDVDINL